MKTLSESFAASLIILLVTVAAGVLSARVLLPQGKGELTAIILWPTVLAQVGSLSLADAVTFYTARRETPVPPILASALAMALALSAVLVIAGYVALPALLANYDPPIVRMGQQYLAFIPMHLLISTLMAAIAGRLHLAQYNLLRALVHVITSAGMIGLYLAGQASVWSFALSSLAANLVTLLLAIWMTLRHGWFQPTLDLAAAGQLVRYGLQSHLGSIASYFNFRLDQVALAALLPATTLGLYAAAFSIGNLAALAGFAISLVVFPQVTGLAAPLKRQAVGQFMRLSIVLLAASATGLLVITPWILVFFFGTAYNMATGPARVLAVAGIPLGCNYVLAAALKALDRPLASSQAQVAGIVVTVIALAVLLPAYQALGAAWASLLSYSASCLYMLWVIQREAGLSLPDLFRPNRNDWNQLKSSFEQARRRLGNSA